MGNAPSRPSPDSTDKLAALLARPLAYAAKGDFALLFRLTGFSATARQIISRMRAAPDYPRWQTQVDTLDESLGDFDALPDEAKRQAVTRSLAILNEITSAVPSPGDTESPLPPGSPDLSAALQKLRTPVEYVKGVGPRRGELLRKRGIETVEDLLFLIPHYYIDVRQLNTIRELTHKQPGALIVEVVAGGQRYSRRTRKRLYEMIVTDGRDVMTLVWFNAPSYMQGRFKNGSKLLVRGVVTEYSFKKSMAHPDVEPWDESEEYRGRLIPRYPLTEGISLKSMVSIVGSALSSYGALLPDGVPEDIRRRLGLMPVAEAVRQIHDPVDDAPSLSDDSYPPIRSLAMDELFILEMGLLLRKKNLIRSPGRSYRAEATLMESFLAGLSFPLTDAQSRVLSEVIADLRAPYPAHRLIQGDVGCGKDRGGLRRGAGRRGGKGTGRAHGAHRNPCRAALSKPLRDVGRRRR